MVGDLLDLVDRLLVRLGGELLLDDQPLELDLGRLPGPPPLGEPIAAAIPALVIGLTNSQSKPGS